MNKIATAEEVQAELKAVWAMTEESNPSRSKLGAALRSLADRVGGLPTNQLIDFPSGRWGFVGRAHAQLSWVKKDGEELSEEDIPILMDASNPSMLGYKQRSFKTVYEAFMAAKRLGQSITISRESTGKHPEIMNALRRSRVHYIIT
jgi:hypothetical protein